MKRLFITPSKPDSSCNQNHGQEVAEFSRLAERLFSRRTFLQTASCGIAAFVMATAPRKLRAANRLTFNAVAANTTDTVILPQGYNWRVVAKWGDGLWSDSIEFDQQSRGTGASQELAIGDNNDGMSLFVHNERTIIAVNNEYVNLPIMFANRESAKPETMDDIRKCKAGHGVAIFEVQNEANTWSIVRDSKFNRRLTADTPMEITGPARAHDELKTAADPEGVRSLGTWNNCGSGRTPWGTYLTCEENFNGYFSSSDPDLVLSEDQVRYGIRHRDRGYNWALADERFDIAKHPNEPNRAGYIVEIDPLDPHSMPAKRTALGRLKHENAEVVLAADGRVVVYMGDDERGEFLYRFVSDGRYVPGGNNRNLLENGSLYAARFNNDGTGAWVALTPQSTGMADQAAICIQTRQAASKVGATTMDRPEWVAVNPEKAEVYCALTNNGNRGTKRNKGGDATPVGGPNPRAENQYGQIVRWWPGNGDHAMDTFYWDLFVVAGNPLVHNDAYAGSANINADNMFNSPDGIAFDHNGLLWIQTDGKYSNVGDFAGMGNNQMLVADPLSGEIKRFMVGPNECEITGITWSADHKTMFVGIQHPGEKGNSHFPDGGEAVPRSCIIAIRRDDAGLLI